MVEVRIVASYALKDASPREHILHALFHIISPSACLPCLGHCKCAHDLDRAHEAPPSDVID
jgi:hypothetical protein